jgi:pyruvate/2-oxoglutarate dehydrogenase complex dihydrolipoamide dehydrogenase (E3) component
VHTGASVSEVRAEGHIKVVTATIGGTSREFRAEAVLVGGGRVGNSDDLGLDEAGVEAGPKGFIRVDGQLRTSQPHILAIGDVKGGWMFTHVATYDGPIAALNAVKDEGREVDYRVVPRAVFSDPTLAAVGLTETEAREAGLDVAVGNVAMGGGTPDREHRSAGRHRRMGTSTPRAGGVQRRLRCHGETRSAAADQALKEADCSPSFRPHRGTAIFSA